MKRFLVRLLAFALMLFTLQTCSVFAADTSAPYKYPVVPQSQEWKNLQSLDEKIQVCKIPDEILNDLSTYDLVETVANYPLAINVYAYDTPIKGVKAVKKYFNGLQELCNREDATEALELFVERFKNKTDSDSKLKRNFASAILAYLLGQNYREVYRLSSREMHSNYTPKGSKIYMHYNLSWEDFNTTASDVNANNEYWKKVYPNAKQLRKPSPLYNCHSYAWYSSAEGNKYWLDGSYAKLFMTDGSYKQTSNPKKGDKVWFGSADHSAIYYSSSKVTSKWGLLGLFRHSLNDCPYSTNEISYWHR